jgi:hypothetical protein
MREGFSCSSPGVTHALDGEGKFEGKGELKGEGKGEKGPKEKDKELQGAISSALSNNTGISGKNLTAIFSTCSDSSYCRLVLIAAYPLY